MARGFFAIGVERSKTEANIGTLWRTAHILGAAFVFTIGKRYGRDRTDVLNSTLHMPCFHFGSIQDLVDACPAQTPIIGIEMEEGARPIRTFHHPERAAYLLGAEDHGLSEDAMEASAQLVRLPGHRSLNVAVAGSIVLFDRVNRATHQTREDGDAD